MPAKVSELRVSNGGVRAATWQQLSTGLRANIEDSATLRLRGPHVA
jgi:hypothetical protein